MNTNNIRSFTTAKRFLSKLEYGGTTYEVEIQTPDLSGPTPTVCGDWGPMYSFEFDEPRTVHVTYRCPELGVTQEVEIPVCKMQLDSPMVHTRRQEHPLFVRFQDSARGLEFHGYLDRLGEPANVEVKELPRSADMPALLRWQPAHTQDWHTAQRNVA